MFCQNCGAQLNEGVRFCGNCGTPVGGGIQEPQQQHKQSSPLDEEEILWSGQQAGLVGKAMSKANVSPTSYILTNERLIVETGILGKKRTEMELFSVKDITVQQSLTERVQKIGSVIIVSSDPSDPKLTIDSIENPQYVADMIRAASTKVKKARNIQYRVTL